MATPIFQVDAFTNRPFYGNPAGVCLLSAPADESWMQNIAREMNLSETAFLYPVEEGYNLRWFTPTVEVALCGHATLASAHVLWESGYLPAEEYAKFHTASGVLTARKVGAWIAMDFPVRPQQSAEPPAGLERALGATPIYIGKNVYDYLVEVDSEEILRSIKPDFVMLATLPVRGVIVTSPSASPEYNFVSRFFAPASGVNEDPVTGSAHCCLGPYWSEKLGQNQLVAYQASPRGGVVRLEVQGERVILEGQAVTVLRGELLETLPGRS